MKKIITALVVLVFGFSFQMKGQIYEAINGLQSVISPALSGSGSYKGSVEAAYSHTIGKYNGDFIEISTSQGYQYNSWFYLGAGMGFDLLLAHKGSNWGEGMVPPPNYKGSTSTAPMLPIFTDFRFLIGDTKNIAFYLSLKVGCSFLLTNKIIPIGQGYLTNREYFFLNPSLAVRIPCNKNKPKQAVDVGVKYKLLTSNYWYTINNNITLQAIGAFISFEW